ncbi:alpha/beta fold hydrolase [Mycobacterium sp. URHB0021]
MWPDGFCAQLIERGYRVIRFDHRDTGLSSKMQRTPRHGVGVPASVEVSGRPGQSVPHILVDLAEDVRGLLDHLEIGRAHVVGASMGGMIAQVLAGSHPDQILSLGLIMTSAGRPSSPVPRLRVIRLAFGAPAKHVSTDEELAFEVRNISIINGPNFLLPVDRVQELRARSDYPQGMLRLAQPGTP